MASFKKQKRKYSLQDKEKLATLAEDFKCEYEKELEESKERSKVWDRRRKKFVAKPTDSMKEGYLAKAVRLTFPSLKNAAHDDPEFQKAVKVAARALENRIKNRETGADQEAGPSKKRFREPGAGRKPQAMEIRQALFEWFVDVRGSLKGRLPMKVFKSKCVELYQQWLEQQSETIKKEDQLKFTKPWIKAWMTEYNVSLLKPNKRYQISKVDRIERLIEFIKNVLRVRYFFLYHHKKEPTIINGDQMPLHRNESAGQKTMSMKNESVFVKENYMLSRERATVYTQVSSEQSIAPEILFKGKGVRIKVNPPEGMNVQFAPKGSYRLDNMCQMVGKLKNRYNMFTCKDYALYILDDYSVHTTQEMRDALLKKGYILVIIGGGVTGDIQVNDTHVHHLLKTKYRDLEAELMLSKLREAPEKIPSPSRDEMMTMLQTSWREVTEGFDTEKALKENFLLNAMDGSEDHQVRDKLFELVGEEIKKFREELLASPPPKLLKDLIKSITPPKGVHAKERTSTLDSAPSDEGRELIDCVGEELQEEEMLEDESEEETEERESTAEPSELPVLKPSSSTLQKPTTTTPMPTNTTDATINNDAKLVNDLSDLLEQHKGETSVLFLPYLCQLKDTIQKARRSLRRRLQVNQLLAMKESTSSSATTHLQLEQATCSEREEASTCATTEEPSTSTKPSLIEEEIHHEGQDQDKNPLTPGTYVRIEHSGQSVPACVVIEEPLSVRYFVEVKSGVFQPGDVLGCQRADIVQNIQEPEIISSGTRQVFYKFDF